MPAGRPSYDVVILGSGIAGSILGAVLARNGVKVLLADAATHPRFAVGESMIPQLVAWLRVLAERYDVPGSVAAALLGGASPHNSSTQVLAGTTFPAFTGNRARSCRCLGAVGVWA